MNTDKMTPTKPVDEHERRISLDPRRSIIVRAPAGSGKTRLLSERFLRLLLDESVQTPEAILATTFTHKAALEIKERIISYLTLAEASDPSELASLARSVLKRDKEKNWQLLERPERLNIMTIDQLTARLSRTYEVTNPLRTPRDAKIITQSPGTPLHPVYETAVLEAFEALKTSDNPALKEGLSRLIARYKNTGAPNLGREESLSAPKQGEGLLSMLSGLLLRRNFLLGGVPQTFDESSFLEAFFLPVQSHLAPILTKLKRLNPDLPLEDDPRSWLEVSRTLANLFLTEKGEPSKRSVFKADGKPAALAQPLLLTLAGPEISEHKDALLALESDVKSNPPLYRRLALTKDFPASGQGAQDPLELSALFALLKLSSEMLHFHFEKEPLADHSEIFYRASRTLDPENATHYAFALATSRLKHLLVDEFQDTESTQLHFFEKLCSGFTQGVESVFIVGDPMQSIYRFRGSEPNVFSSLMQDLRFGGLELTPVSLRTNFRSTPKLVDFAGELFSSLLPENDPWAQAVQFEPSQGFIEPKDDRPPLGLHPEESKQAELEKTLSLIQSSLKEGASSVGVLTRKNSDAASLIRFLKREAPKLPLVQTDSPESTPIHEDLLSLAAFLESPKDRFASLNLLKTHWFRLSFKDFLSLWPPQCKSPNREASVSKEGERAADAFFQFKDWLNTAQMQRNKPRLLLDSLRSLNALCPLSPNEIPTIFSLLKALFSFEEETGSLDPWFQGEFSYYQSYGAKLNLKESETEQGIHVTTIHKSKGLEYDAVILPFLESGGRNGRKSFLFLESGAALPPTRQDKDPTPYTALLSQDKAQEQSELVRLAYVAATRARHHLHLVWSAEKNTSKTLLSLFTQGSTLVCEAHRAAHEALKARKDAQNEANAQSLLVGRESQVTQSIHSQPQEDLPRPSTPEAPTEAPPSYAPPPLPRPQSSPLKLRRDGYLGLFHTRRGTLLHKALQLLIGSPELAISSLREHSLLEGYLSKEDTREALLSLESALATDPSFEHMRKRTLARTEAPLFDPLTSGLKYADALLFHGEHHLCILDWKFREPDLSLHKDSSLEDIDAHLTTTDYADQLRTYRRLLGEAEGREVSLWLYFPLLPLAVKLDPERGNALKTCYTESGS